MLAVDQARHLRPSERGILCCRLSERGSREISHPSEIGAVDQPP
jgi:hypothetical protein